MMLVMMDTQTEVPFHEQLPIRNSSQIIAGMLEKSGVTRANLFVTETRQVESVYHE